MLLSGVVYWPHHLYRRTSPNDKEELSDHSHTNPERYVTAEVLPGTYQLLQSVPTNFVTCSGSPVPIVTENAEVGMGNSSGQGSIHFIPNVGLIQP